MLERPRSFLLTYVGVAHDQRSLGVFGLELDELLQRYRGHPGYPFPTKGECLWACRLCHQLWKDRTFSYHDYHYKYSFMNSSSTLPRETPASNEGVILCIYVTIWMRIQINYQVLHLTTYNKFWREDQLLRWVQWQKVNFVKQLRLFL